MITCKEATALAAKSQDASLTFKQRIQLRIHLCVCRLCTRYVRQLQFLKQALQRLNDNPPMTHLSPDAKQRIKDALETQTKHEPRL